MWGYGEEARQLGTRVGERRAAAAVPCWVEVKLLRVAVERLRVQLLDWRAQQGGRAGGSPVSSACLTGLRTLTWLVTPLHAV